MTLYTYNQQLHNELMETLEVMKEVAALPDVVERHESIDAMLCKTIFMLMRYLPESENETIGAIVDMWNECDKGYDKRRVVKISLGKPSSHIGNETEASLYDDCYFKRAEPKHPIGDEPENDLINE